ncbi:hypothetical protein BCT25_01830 [Vibrio sp. 10N.261.45.A6]|nr:hypothetical protein BCT66_08015 [Vibrio sp. 10N.261.49.E11]PMN80281.1 hypothetical protein BCT25_01830 [Vibrio sp. 10N.261.45.A6]PMN82201.1 hypothetical protein BCT22_13930 [Vibrio sp. 10N.261.45.A1]
MTYISTLLLFLFLYFGLKVIHPPSPWLNGIRYFKAGVIGIALTAWLILIDAPQPVFIGTILFGLWVGVGYSVTVKLHELTLLSLTPSLRSNQYHVHLSSLIQPFTRDTYRELELLIELLPKYNGQSLILTSPLLAKQGSLRNMEQLKKLPVHIEASYHSYWRSPLEFLVLCYYKHIKRENILQHSDLSRQYRLLLTLRS